MIVGFSKYGRGSGQKAVEYLTEGMPSAVDYFTGESRRGVKRDPPPFLLRGSPELTERLISEVPFERRYVSGVLSFSEKEIAPEQEIEIMDRFEAVAFAGLEKDRWNTLWVRHSHTGRHEMHFLSPAVDLVTGKNLNINPPRQSTRETFDTFRTLINDEFNFTDPDDPARAREVRLPSHLLKSGKEDFRTNIASFIQTKSREGVIQSRDDVLRALTDAGFQIARAGDKYITIVDPSGSRCRLKGSLFARDQVPRVAPSRLFSSEQRAQLESKLNRHVAARAEFNRKRYPVRKNEASLSRLDPNLKSSHDRIGNAPAQVVGAPVEGISRPRSTVGATLERTHAAACSQRSAVSELDRAAHDLRLTTQSFDLANRAVAVRLDRAVAHLQTRAVTAAIYQKYGARAAGTGRQQEAAVEQAMEYEHVLANS